MLCELSARRFLAIVLAAIFLLAMAPSAVCFCEDAGAKESSCDEPGDGCGDEGTPQDHCDCQCAQTCCGQALFVADLAAAASDSEACDWLWASASEPLHGAEPLTPTLPPRA
jgi:hypothetical protein